MESQNYKDVYSNLMGTSNPHIPKERKRHIDYHFELLPKKYVDEMEPCEKEDISYVKGPDDDDLNILCDIDEELSVIPGENINKSRMKEYEKHAEENVRKLMDFGEEFFSDEKPRMIVRKKSPYYGPLTLRINKKNIILRLFDPIFGFFYNLILWIGMVFGFSKKKKESDYFVRIGLERKRKDTPKQSVFERDFGILRSVEEEETYRKRKFKDDNLKGEYLMEKSKSKLKNIAKKMRSEDLKEQWRLYKKFEDHIKRDVAYDELQRRGKVGRT